MIREHVLTSELKIKADKIIANYEQKRAALLPILHLIQDTYGHVMPEAEQEIADFLQIPLVDVREVMTFYTLFHSKPCAKYQFNVCRTLTCSLLGGGEITEHLKHKLGIDIGEQTADRKFGLNAVECLGACEIAPMMQMNKDYTGPLTKEKVDQILNSLSS